MYPNTSTFQSNAPGSAWAIIGQVAAREVVLQAGAVQPGDRIIMGQWDSFLRHFQRNGRNLLPPTWSFNMQTAVPNAGTARTRDSLVVTGQWDAVTAEAMMYLLACAGEDHLNTVVAALPTAASPLFDSSITGAAIMFGLFVSRVGTPTSPSLDDAAIQFAERFRMPNGVVLPSLAVPVVSAAADQTWFAIFTPSAQAALPVPPSAGGPAAATPPAVAPVQTATSIVGGDAAVSSKGMSTASKVVLAGALVGIAYLIYREGSSDPRSNPSPRDGNMKLREYGERLGRINHVPDHAKLRSKGYNAAQQELIIQAARSERNRIYGAPKKAYHRPAQDEYTVVKTTRTTSA